MSSKNRKGSPKCFINKVILFQNSFSKGILPNIGFQDLRVQKLISFQSLFKSKLSRPLFIFERLFLTI